MVYYELHYYLSNYYGRDIYIDKFYELENAKVYKEVLYNYFYNGKIVKDKMSQRFLDKIKEDYSHITPSMGNLDIIGIYKITKELVYE
jgi:hypothetical protein